MVPTKTPLYRDWHFWSLIIAILALALSLFSLYPTVRLRFLPSSLEIEAPHPRIEIAHYIGNPNIELIVSVRNTGGQDVHVKKMEISISRDKQEPKQYLAQTYYEDGSVTSMFLPFTLKPGEKWLRRTVFYKEFNRDTDIHYRRHKYALNKNINAKQKARPNADVTADQALVDPLSELFHSLFVWWSGEYVVELKVFTEENPEDAFTKKYRFTLYEADSHELQLRADNFKFGNLYSDIISVQLHPHND